MKNDTVMNIAISKELKEKAQEYAKSKSISLNSLVRLALSEYLEKK
jgi:predicted HicB family RNase H-like nuclease